ncbi:toxin-antitoxin system HicB family antitoxin [Cyanobium sp. Morenito 9A2]|nr:toxin-antitoxin system HicB family antitoxin [Cyanobium sp. Morenito 9A2]
MGFLEERMALDPAWLRSAEDLNNHWTSFYRSACNKVSPRRHVSGEFNLRTPPEPLGTLAMTAEAQGKRSNTLAQKAHQRTVTAWRNGEQASQGDRPAPISCLRPRTLSYHSGVAVASTSSGLVGDRPSSSAANGQGMAPLLEDEARPEEGDAAAGDVEAEQRRDGHQHIRQDSGRGTRECQQQASNPVHGRGIVGVIRAISIRVKRRQGLGCGSAAASSRRGSIRSIAPTDGSTAIGHRLVGRPRNTALGAFSSRSSRSSPSPSSRP